MKKKRGMPVGGVAGILYMELREVSLEKVTPVQRSEQEEGKWEVHPEEHSKERQWQLLKHWGLNVSGDLQERQRATVAPAPGELGGTLGAKAD